jgi:hypothetical protein
VAKFRTVILDALAVHDTSERIHDKVGVLDKPKTYIHESSESRSYIDEHPVESYSLRATKALATTLT